MRRLESLEIVVRLDRGLALISGLKQKVCLSFLVHLDVFHVVHLI